jgi:hypothetical protein
MDKF